MSMLVCAFEKEADVTSRTVLLSAAPAAVGFVRMPFARGELARAAEKLADLDTEQMNQLLRRGCGLREEWRHLGHALAGAVSRWPTQRASAETILGNWAASVREFAPAQALLVERVDRAFGGDPEKIWKAVQELEDSLLGRSGAQFDKADRSELPEAPVGRPPRGFSAVAIADDQGYEPSTIEALRRRGYDVSDPARNTEQVAALLQFFRPQVVLADLFFPSRDDGDAVIRRALETESVRLVIATSRARVGVDELPSNVEHCCGGLDFQDAERIHRLIWRRALAEGAEPHA